jgi:hypothetical protein
MRELGKAEHIADSLCSARTVLVVVPPQKFDQHDPVRPRSPRRAESAVSCLAGWSVRCSLVETIITHTFRGIKSTGSATVVSIQQSVVLDYCLRWNNASQKVIIAATISTYRLAMGATECD